MRESRTGSDVSQPWGDRERLGFEAYMSTPSVIIVVDDERRIGAINPAAEQLTGLAHGDVVGQPLSTLMAPGTLEDGLAAIERAAAGEIIEADIAFVTPHSDEADPGGQVVVGVRAAPLFLEGEPAGLVLSGRDVEDRQRLEHQLGELETGFRLLSEASEIGIYRFAFDPDFRVEHANRAFADAIGFTEGELQRDPTPLNDGLEPDVRQRFIDNRFGPGPELWPIEFAWHRPDGEVVVLSVEEVSVRDRDGRILAALGIGRDVTQERRREASIIRALQHERQAADGLRQVDQLRRLFLQAVSHELRTPLTTVLGFAGTLAGHADELPREQIAHLSDRMVSQAQRIERLLDDLLDVERLSRGVLTLRCEEHDLGDVIADVVADLADDRVTVEAAATTIEIDRGKIERVAVNLITNARRHAGPGARIRVAVVAEDDGATLIVEDDGPGVPDELKEAVFEPFAQGPASQADPSPGTGIGLTLVAEFVRLHGGAVRIEDVATGGARFVVFLPRAAAT